MPDPVFDASHPTAFQTALLGHVAGRLYASLGADAVQLATGAIRRLHQAHDAEGAALWMDLHSRLLRLASRDGAPSPVIH
jgi:hypothetical protein